WRQEPERVQVEQGDRRAPDAGAHHDRDVALVLHEAADSQLERRRAAGRMAGKRRVGALQLIAARDKRHQIVREADEEKEGIDGVERRPVDTLRIEGAAGGDSAFATRRIEVTIRGLAVVGGADIERAARWIDLRQVEARAAHGLVDGLEPIPRARADEAALLEHLGRRGGPPATT